MIVNIKRLREIKKQILAEPSQFDMTVYFSAKPTSTCGTASCIAGWALWLYAKNFQKSLKINVLGHLYSDYPEHISFKNLAAKLLGLTYLQAERIFFSNQWPLKFYRKYRLALTDEDKAKVAAEYIDYLIKREQNRKKKASTGIQK